MHQIRSVTLYSYLDVTSFLGIDGIRLLSNVGISPTAIDRVEERLPAGDVVSLLESSASVSGCDSFGIRMAECRSFASLGPLSLLLERLEDIAAVLATLSSASRSLSDVLFVSTQAQNGSVLATFDMVAPFGQPQAADLTIALGYMALVGASHGRWAPDAVHFTHGAPEDRGAFDRFFGAPIVFNSDFNGFSFAEQALSIGLPLRDGAMAANARRLLQLETLPDTTARISDHVRHSIALALPVGRAALSDVAKRLSTTERGLQRKLNSEGETFVGLLNEVRRDLAQRQLGDSSRSLTVIAQSIGYADLSSFTRWFEREFETPPSRWRKDLHFWRSGAS